MQNKAPSLYGITCYLTEVSEDDTDFIISIRTDEALNSLSGPDLSRDEHLKWLEAYKRNPNDLYWVVRDLDTDERMGTTALFDIDFKSNKAENGRAIILEQYRYCVFEFFYLKTQYAFDILKMNKVYCKVREAETKILRFNVQKLGYKIDGMLRQDWWDGKRYHNFHLISMLRSEFETHKIKKYPKYLDALKRISKIQ
ncbi:MAG: GNAT family protein [Candidatus Cloacimonetes bacterium]|nr:GNAT family protein [Candidatus Cloacimonadota bacterium]